jgi:hypothetical protein
VETPWTVQVIQTNIYIVADMSRVITDIRNSGVTRHEIQKLILLDKTEKTKSDILKSYTKLSVLSLSDISRPKNSREDVLAVVQYRIHGDDLEAYSADIEQFVEAFDNASLAHAKADRFKYFKYTSKGFEHLVLLHCILKTR